MPDCPGGHLPDWESDPSAADGCRDAVCVSISLFTDTTWTRTFFSSLSFLSEHPPPQRQAGRRVLVPQMRKSSTQVWTGRAGREASC